MIFWFGYFLLGVLFTIFSHIKIQSLTDGHGDMMVGLLVVFFIMFWPFICLGLAIGGVLALLGKLMRRLT